MTLHRLGLFASLTGMLLAEPIAQIPPFSGPGGAQTAANLFPQTGPVGPSFSRSALVFGFNGLDSSTLVDEVSSGDSSTSATWDQYAGATASASVQNGDLRVGTSVTGTIPQGFFDVEAFATAYFQDALTITSASIPDGTLGFFI